MPVANKDDFINYRNGSQHPFRGGGLFIGRVTAAGGGNRVSVKIPSLGLQLRSCAVLDTTAARFLSAGDSVICGFLENDNQDVVVLGRINIALDVFAKQTELDALTATVQALEARVSALENP